MKLALSGIPNSLDLTAPMVWPCYHVLADKARGDPTFEKIRPAGDSTGLPPNRTAMVSQRFLNNNRNKKIVWRSPERAGAAGHVKAAATLMFLCRFPARCNRTEMGLARRIAQGGSEPGFMVPIKLVPGHRPLRQRPVYDPLIQALSGWPVQAGARRTASATGQTFC